MALILLEYVDLKFPETSHGERPKRALASTG
jgi:hypothetical protein